MSDIVSINPNAPLKLDAQGKVAKKKYTVLGRLTQNGAMRTGVGANGKPYAYLSMRRESDGSFLDLSINATILERVQAAITSGELKVTGRITVFGEFFTKSDGTQGFQVLGMQNALSKADYAKQQNEKRAARASA